MLHTDKSREFAIRIKKSMPAIQLQKELLSIFENGKQISGDDNEFNDEIVCVKNWKKIHIHYGIGSISYPHNITFANWNFMIDLIESGE